MTQDSQYQNAKGANTFGAELELRSDLARLARRCAGSASAATCR